MHFAEMGLVPQPPKGVHQGQLGALKAGGVFGIIIWESFVAAAYRCSLDLMLFLTHRHGWVMVWGGG